jgi:hypothetical protein
MAPYSDSLSLNQYPPDLIQAVAQNAADDADRVGQFLTEIGLRPAAAGAAPPAPVRLPTFFLVGLGATLRLLAWEQRGLHAHRDAGLPSAREAISQVVRAVTGPEPILEKEQAASQLALRVLAFFVESLAWNGRAILDADVELGEAEEEPLVDALAQFLWTHRHDHDDALLTGGGLP